MLAFVDMETTGLDADKDVPLELGIILTDNFGNGAYSASWLIMESNDEFLLSVADGQSNVIVNEMHEKSGLWRALVGSETCERADADRQAVAWLETHHIGPGQIGMAGNSIGSLDRPFAIKHFPLLNEFLGYRNIDMSSIKELCKRVNPILFDQLRPIVENKESADHRVLGDCRAAIREYKAYLDNFLIVGD